MDLIMSVINAGSFGLAVVGLDVGSLGSGVGTFL
jgi:hypothetical protein